MINRREFLASIAAGGLLASTAAMSGASSRAGSASPRFQLNYAPHFGMFRHSGGDDLLDQLRFAADEGFVAFEDNGLRSRSLAFQDRMRREMDRRGMQMGLFVGTADFANPTFASGRSDVRQKVLADMRLAAQTARRMNGRWCSVILGKSDSRLSRRQQTVNAVDLLRRCADICEPAGLVMLLEPIGHLGSAAGLFLRSLPQAHEICCAVNRPSCKILLDVYWQQNAGANIFDQLRRYGSQIAYIQVGDNPGRKEPGTGSFDFQSLFRWLREQRYQGIVGMEHGNFLPGRRGEQAVIEAYLRHDAE
ncbi:MAG: TIM barrel protein [Planctomycetaceae bacterium]